MYAVKWVSLASLLLTACGDNHWDATMKRSEVDALLQAVAKTPLPPGATEVYGRTASLFNTVVDIRFTCGPQDLARFLAESSVLPKELVAGERTVLDSMCGATWWRPDELNAVSGAEQTWTLDSGKASGLIMAGSAQEADKVVVYLCVTIE